MIRRDYILRMIQEVAEALRRIRVLKNDRRLEDAKTELEAEFKRLFGEDSDALLKLSENDLLVRLISLGPTQAMKDQSLAVTALLREAGDLAVAAERLAAGRECYLKALNLLLYTLLQEREVFDAPEFVPRVAELEQALRGAPLPPVTLARLMQHHERTGEFAKAEDALFALLETDPNTAAIREFGISFYERLLSQSDRALETGNLPRAEVEQGLREWRDRPPA